ncbi:MAG: LiaI-LiaF-like domain-containing protein [Candidatus Eisenbacteria bacterium]
MSYEMRRTIRRSLWGVLFILVGLGFLLDQMRVIHLRHWTLLWWRWWPATLILIGLGNMLVPLTPKHISSGLFMMLLGAWFFVCQSEWHGFTYRTGWPLLIVAMGVNVVIGAVLEHVWPRRRVESAGTREEQGHA